MQALWEALHGGKVILGGYAVLAFVGLRGLLHVSCLL
jgi:hypothetical protein